MAVRLLSSQLRVISCSNPTGTFHTLAPFSSASVRCQHNGGAGGDPPGPCRPPPVSRRRRSLSPLERISSLLPPDHLSPEVLQLRDPEGPQQQEESPSMEEEEEQTLTSLSCEGGPPWPLLPGETPLSYGELLIAEHQKKRADFKKMFKLQEGGRLHSSWGALPHQSVAGKPSGCSLRTTMGVPIFIRRPSLEDYVLHMRRGPAITYPKDAAVMMMMMDVNQGDCVLESGSGSGAMSLFLSRAVGSTGCVLSVEVREDHHRGALANYEQWRASWRLRRGQEWPHNVRFLHADLGSASSLPGGWGFHAAALDLINPQLVMTSLLPHLHLGAVCAVYLANITQVVDLLEGIRCASLPFRCERVVEVPLRDWLVATARHKDGRCRLREAPPTPEEDTPTPEEDTPTPEENTDDQQQLETPGFGGVAYIARPHQQQLSHTAFLVKLRKHVS